MHLAEIECIQTEINLNGFARFMKAWKNGKFAFECVPDCATEQRVYEFSRSTIAVFLRILAMQKDLFNVESVACLGFNCDTKIYSTNLQSSDFASEFAYVFTFLTEIERILEQQVIVILHSDLESSCVAITAIPEHSEDFELILQTIGIAFGNSACRFTKAYNVVAAVNSQAWRNQRLRQFVCSLVYVLLTDKTLAPDFLAICKKTKPGHVKKVLVMISEYTKSKTGATLTYLSDYQDTLFVHNCLSDYLRQYAHASMCAPPCLYMQLASCKYLLFKKQPPDIKLWPLVATYIPRVHQVFKFRAISAQLQEEYDRRLEQGVYTAGVEFDCCWNEGTHCADVV